MFYGIVTFPLMCRHQERKYNPEILVFLLFQFAGKLTSHYIYEDKLESKNSISKYDRFRGGYNYVKSIF